MRSSIGMRDFLQFGDAEILAARPAKNSVDANRPYAFLVEPECTAAGHIEDVATIFLTNRECPFRCLFCDLWKNTTDESVPRGAIPAQIDHALEQLPPAQHIKLYNSGNFFDAQAIPPEDHAEIANRVRDFQSVIVENHPKLCGRKCGEFHELIQTRLEIALGLETVHPEILPRLNKQMTLDDFQHAVEFLIGNDIAVRTFILLRPPTLSESEGIDWALRSIDFAFRLGVGCCSIIPMRSGNGMMEQLKRKGLFSSPSLLSMESVLQEGIKRNAGRVFMDLWDAERFSDCEKCGPLRIERLRQMNLTQTVLPAIDCGCGATP